MWKYFKGEALEERVSLMKLNLVNFGIVTTNPKVER